MGRSAPTITVLFARAVAAGGGTGKTTEKRGRVARLRIFVEDIDEDPGG